MFDSGGSSIFTLGKVDEEYMLGLLNSELATYIVKCLNPTVNTQVGDIGRIPIAKGSSFQQDNIRAHVDANIAIKKHLCTYSVVEQNYSHSPITPVSSPESELTRYYNYENALLTQILLNEAIINRIVFDVYELSDHDRQMVLDKEEIGRAHV